MSAPAKTRPTSMVQAPARAILNSNSVLESPVRAIVVTTPDCATPAHLLTIRHLGQVLDDLERVRIANGNRISAAEREFGSSLPHLEVVQHQLLAIEHEAHLELCRAWRKHPLAPWAKSYRGCGEKSIARLVAAIGDPAERPNVAKLWSYCGVGSPDRIRIPKNATQAELMARGNPSARKQAWQISTGIVKACVTSKDGPRRALFPEGEIYVATRLKYADAGITDGHAHARALRATAKSFLRDLWVAARADQLRREDQQVVVGAGEEHS